MPLACDPAWLLSEPEEVPGIAAGQSAGQQRLSPDETEVYFDRVLENVRRMLYARRADRDAAFGGETILLGVESENFQHYWPSISSDGLTLSYSRFREGEQQILDARRPSVDVEFGPGEVLANDSLLLFRVPDSDEYFYARYDERGQQSVVDATPAGETLPFPDHPGDDLPYWYEPGSQVLWLSRDGVQLFSVRGPNGFGEPANAEQAGVKIRVSWGSPDGCRLYGDDPDDRSGTLKLQRRKAPQ